MSMYMIQDFCNIQWEISGRNKTRNFLPISEFLRKKRNQIFKLKVLFATWKFYELKNNSQFVHLKAV